MKLKWLRIGILIMMLLMFLLCTWITVSKKCNAEDEEAILNTMETQKNEKDTEYSVDMMIAYRKYLENLQIQLTNQRVEENAENVGVEVAFSIADVTGDGECELLVLFKIDGMEKSLSVLSCERNGGQSMGQPITLIELWPVGVKFYGNGVVMEEWSHNQSRVNGSIWPFNLYQYNENQKSYEYIASAMSWKRDIETENLFFNDVDEDGNGEIYIIAYEQELGAGMDISNKEEWVDDAIYNEWYASIIEESQEINIFFEELTEENILRAFK
ncbi:MAG: hypothetical protein K2F83_01835 [Oscillospiraceae bacterium]|nr:hypothetical protein [Oscillospiraceae bacterium]